MSKTVRTWVVYKVISGLTFFFQEREWGNLWTPDKRVATRFTRTTARRLWRYHEAKSDGIAYGYAQAYRI